MLTYEEQIKMHLVSREELLLKKEIRSDADRSSSLIEDKCIEILDTGTRKSFTSGTALGKIEGEVYINTETVQLLSLSDSCKMLVYDAGRVHKDKRQKIICSSVWKSENDSWKVVFHQRTLVTD